MQEIDVVVIGAGAAGVAAARKLLDSGVPNVVVEARTRVGGRAWTFHDGKIALDVGCAWLHSADENEWTQIAPLYGLTVDDLPPPWERPAHPVNFPPEMQTQYRVAWERFYACTDEAAAADSDRPMSECFEPGGRFNGMLGAMMTFINGTEAENLNAREYARYHDSGQNKRVAQGYGTLVEAHAHGLDVRLGCPVTLIDHSGARVRVTTPQGEIEARAVIVAVPPGVMANESVRLTPALPNKLAAAHALPLGVADKMFLRVDDPEDLPKETRLYGSTTTVETGIYTLRPSGRAIIDGYFGGKFACALEDEGEGALTAFAIEQIAAQLGGDMRKRLHPIIESAWARDPWSLGSYSYGGVGAEAARAALARSVDDRLFFAGEHCSAADFSTAHGAYRTGVAAAEAAITALRG